MAGRNRSEIHGDGTRADLARRLRTLRDGHGLTLRQLATRSGYSAAALSAAESGKHVPTWDLVSAFVQACGDEPRTWRQLWEVAGREGDGDGPPRPAADPLEHTPQAGAGRRPRLAHVVGGSVLVIAIAVAIGWFAGRQNASSAAPPPSPSSSSSSSSKVNGAVDGTDPYDDRCKADEKQLDWKPVSFPDGRSFGTLLLMYSPACEAAWGYLNGPNSTAWTTHIVAHRLPDQAQAPFAFHGNAALGSWGNVLSTRPGCVYIEAYVVDSHGEGSHARTACMQPTAPVTTR